jgi:hemoglobin
MNCDITCEEDVKKVISTFTSSVEKDALISRYFAHVNWGEQMPVMCKFWSTLLFRAGKFTGRPFPKHVALQGLEERHYNRLTDLFNKAVSNYFSGEKAEMLKMKVRQICLAYESRLMLVSEDD